MELFDKFSMIYALQPSRLVANVATWLHVHAQPALHVLVLS